MSPFDTGRNRFFKTGRAGTTILRVPTCLLDEAKARLKQAFKLDQKYKVMALEDEDLEKLWEKAEQLPMPSHTLAFFVILFYI